MKLIELVDTLKIFKERVGYITGKNLCGKYLSKVGAAQAPNRLNTRMNQLIELIEVFGMFNHNPNFLVDICFIISLRSPVGNNPNELHTTIMDIMECLFNNFYRL